MIETVAALSNLIPIVGGAVSNVLSVPWAQRADIPGLSDLAVPYAEERAFIETNQDALEHLASMDLVTFSAARSGRHSEPNIRTVPAYPRLTNYGQRFAEFVVGA